jgi:hypothetical protein
MAFLALVIGEGGVRFLPLFVVIILFLEEMDENIFGAVKGLGVEELKGVMRGGQMAVHAVGHETLRVVHVG